MEMLFVRGDSVILVGDINFDSLCYANLVDIAHATVNQNRQSS